MKQDKWTQQLHDKLADHQVAAPEGLWSNIEAALDRQAQPAAEKPAARKPRFIALRRWAVAASIAALVVGGVYWGLLQPPSIGGGYQAEVPPSRRTMEEVKRITDSDTQDHRITNPLEQSLSRYKVRGTRRENTPSEQDSNPAADSVMISDPIKETDNQTAKVEEVERITNPDTQDSPLTTHQPPNPPVGGYVPRRGTIGGSHSPKISVSLYASNAIGDYKGNNGVLMADALAQNYLETYEAGNHRLAPKKDIYLTGYEERQHHYQPFSFGLNVSYPLTPRLSVSTGVNYTWMRSDFTQIIQTQKIQQKQTLHYIGVPVSASYFLWGIGKSPKLKAQSSKLKAYVTAGMEADWNVKTHFETEGVTQPLKSDRMQWSVRGSLGIDYSVIPQLSLYAEPGVAYYFDNGSRMLNLWKDKPLNLTLQMGIRFNLSSQSACE